MSQSTTAQQRITKGIFDLANGYPEIYEDDEGAGYLGGHSRMRRLEEIMHDVVRHRPDFDPNYPNLGRTKETQFIWLDEIVPFNPKQEERKLVDLYWRMAASETNAGLREVIKDRQPIFSQSASYALDLIASVLKMRGIRSVRLVNPSLDIFTDLLAKKNGLSVKPISESELRYTGAPPVKRDYRNMLAGKKTAVVVISPNNPTGAYIAEQELKKLAAFCKENGIPLIMDSVFRPYHSRPYDDIAVLEKSGCTYAIIGDTGKAVPTLLFKAGFIICSKDWHEEIDKTADIFGQVPLTQLVILRKSIRDHDISGFRDMIATVEWNRLILNAAVVNIKRPGVTLEPCASHVPFGWITLPSGESSSELVRQLRERDRVAVADGAPFLRAKAEVSGIRVSLARPSGYFCGAVEQLFTGLNRA